MHDTDIAHIDLVINTPWLSIRSMWRADIDLVRHLLWYVFCMCFMTGCNWLQNHRNTLDCLVRVFMQGWCKSVCVLLFAQLCTKCVFETCVHTL